MRLTRRFLNVMYSRTGSASLSNASAVQAAESSASQADVVRRLDRDDFEWSARARRVLGETFGARDYRPLQRAVVNAVMAGEDALFVSATGSGKSLTFQLPAVLLDGVTLVVSPLVSLMEDQLLSARRLGIPVDSLTESTGYQAATRVHRQLVEGGGCKLLYVTPEKLARGKAGFMEALRRCYDDGRLKLMAVDEVHCCSMWGHDFRTDYKLLNMLRRDFGGVPLLGVTATASAPVVHEVKAMLGVPHAHVIRSTFDRPNLFYEVRHKTTSRALLDDIYHFIQESYADQTGIIYCLSQRETEELAESLRERGLRCQAYHADMPLSARSAAHRAWSSGECQVIVSTIAFGMGIDKPNVRFIIHHSMAKSLENYYQESGRAGRDGQPSTCLLYYRFGDVFRQSGMLAAAAAGDDGAVSRGLGFLYGMLDYCTDGVRCRRAVVARHFADDTAGQQHDSVALCARTTNCSVCLDGDSQQLVAVDVSAAARAALGLASAGAPLSPLMLAAALGKTAAAGALRPVERELLVARLLLGGYLREKFEYSSKHGFYCYATPVAERPLCPGAPFVLHLQQDVKKAPRRRRPQPARPSPLPADFGALDDLTDCHRDRLLARIAA